MRWEDSHIGKDIYETMLKKEVLLEVGAGAYARICNYEDRQGSSESKEVRLLSAMRKTVAAAQHNILIVETDEELDRIRGQFDFVRACFKELERENE